MSSLVSNANDGEADNRDNTLSSDFKFPSIFFTAIAALSLERAFASAFFSEIYLPKVKTSTLKVPPSFFTIASSTERVSLSSQKTTILPLSPPLSLEISSAAASMQE